MISITVYDITYLLKQGDGWPLGLQPLNVRVGLVRNSDLNGSVSSNTLLTASTSAESYSSDLDTEVSAYKSAPVFILPLCYGIERTV